MTLTYNQSIDDDDDDNDDEDDNDYSLCSNNK